MHAYRHTHMGLEGRLSLVGDAFLSHRTEAVVTPTQALVVPTQNTPLRSSLFIPGLAEPSLEASSDFNSCQGVALAIFYVYA